MVTDVSRDKTDAGNYFISNYPPFAYWKTEQQPHALSAFDQPATTQAPLGLYLHIPFCRKRCKFCYFRVYTDVNASVIQDYVDSLAAEIDLVARTAAVQGRPFRFVYFGGGTPSYLAAKQLRGLVDQLQRSIGWDQAEEVTFECEPGTLQLSKLETIKDIGVTRLSLGIENFDDAILEENGRAHLSAEVYRAWEWIKQVGFRQVNIDLIAGMVGETTPNWKETIRKTIELDPDSVTIYQMELPFNTRYVKEFKIVGQDTGVADWSVKRDWLLFAMEELQSAGYEVSSAYTMVKKERRKPGDSTFFYRDHLWHGADLIGTGVASFGHLQGVHYQNLDSLETYQAAVAAGQLPINRAYVTNADERLTREMILQMKTGSIDARYFREKFNAEIFERFSDQFADLCERGLAAIGGDRLTLTANGLLRVDSLLPAFFAPEHRGSRYA